MGKTLCVESEVGATPAEVSFFTCIDPCNSESWFNKMLWDIERDYIKKSIASGVPMSSQAIRLYEAHIAAVCEAYTRAASGGAIPAAEAAWKRLLVLLEWVGCGRSSEGAYLSWNGVKWHTPYSAASLLWTCKKTSKQHDLLVFPAFRNRHMCVYYAIAQALVAGFFHRLEDSARANISHLFFPELANHGSVASVVTNVIRAVGPEGDVQKLAPYQTKLVPPGATAGGIRAGGSTVATMRAGIEAAVAITNHTMEGYSSFFKYLDVALVMTGPGALALAGWPKGTIGDYSRVPASHSLDALRSGCPVSLTALQLEALVSRVLFLDEPSMAPQQLCEGGQARPFAHALLATLVYYWTDACAAGENFASQEHLVKAVMRVAGISNEAARVALGEWSVASVKAFDVANAHMLSPHSGCVERMASTLASHEAATGARLQASQRETAAALDAAARVAAEQSAGLRSLSTTVSTLLAQVQTLAQRGQPSASRSAPRSSSRAAAAASDEEAGGDGGGSALSLVPVPSLSLSASALLASVAPEAVAALLRASPRHSFVKLWLEAPRSRADAMLSAGGALTVLRAAPSGAFLALVSSGSAVLRGLYARLTPAAFAALVVSAPAASLASFTGAAIEAVPEAVVAFVAASSQVAFLQLLNAAGSAASAAFHGAAPASAAAASASSAGGIAAMLSAAQPSAVLALLRASTSVAIKALMSAAPPASISPLVLAAPFPAAAELLLRAEPTAAAAAVKLVSKEGALELLLAAPQPAVAALLSATEPSAVKGLLLDAPQSALAALLVLPALSGSGGGGAASGVGDSGGGAAAAASSAPGDRASLGASSSGQMVDSGAAPALPSSAAAKKPATNPLAAMAFSSGSSGALIPEAGLKCVPMYLLACNGQFNRRLYVASVGAKVEHLCLIFNSCATSEEAATLRAREGYSIPRATEAATSIEALVIARARLVFDRLSKRLSAAGAGSEGTAPPSLPPTWGKKALKLSNIDTLMKLLSKFESELREMKETPLSAADRATLSGAAAAAVPRSTRAEKTHRRRTATSAGATGATSGVKRPRGGSASAAAAAAPSASASPARPSAAAAAASGGGGSSASARRRSGRSSAAAAAAVESDGGEASTARLAKRQRLTEGKELTAPSLGGGWAFLGGASGAAKSRGASKGKGGR